MGPTIVHKGRHTRHEIQHSKPWCGGPGRIGVGITTIGSPIIVVEPRLCQLHCTAGNRNQVFGVPIVFVPLQCHIREPLLNMMRMPCSFRHHRFVFVFVFVLVIIILQNRVISGGLDQHPQFFLFSFRWLKWNCLLLLLLLVLDFVLDFVFVPTTGLIL